LEVTTADTLRLDDALATESLPHEEKMETEPGSVSQSDSSDVLLDLGELEPVGAVADDEFVLDLDDDGSDVVAPAYEPAPARAFVEPQVKEAVATAASSYSSFADTQEVPFVTAAPYQAEVKEIEAEPEPQPQPRASTASTDQLSPEMIDAIARRAVELMSDKVIREIAWEVVPDLAELLIKRQLEEKAK
jgi:hypothetical protein